MTAEPLTPALSPPPRKGEGEAPLDDESARRGCASRRIPSSRGSMPPRRRRTLRYAYGILRNRMEIRPAQREPIIRWLGYLKANGNSIGTICDLCAKATSAQHFYNAAKQLLPPNGKVSDAAH